MRRANRVLTAAVVLAALVQPGLARAQNGNGDAPPVIAPEAMTALQKMGAYLRTLNQFQIRSAVTTEQVLEDGQKVQLASSIDLIADRPNRMIVNLSSDREQRQYLFDGKEFTIWAPLLNYYATVPAPATIIELLTQVEDKYDIEIPLVDLFRWGADDDSADEITAAKDLGPSVIDGTTVQHFAFRQDGLDWQVWIQNGDHPLPRKVVLTTMTDEARPQHTAVYTWNLAPSFNPEAFTFVPPKDAKRIHLAEVKPLHGVERKK
jgi:hypothetical protein